MIFFSDQNSDSSLPWPSTRLRCLRFEKYRTFGKKLYGCALAKVKIPPPLFGTGWIFKQLSEIRKPPSECGLSVLAGKPAGGLSLDRPMGADETTCSCRKRSLASSSANSSHRPCRALVSAVCSSWRHASLATLSVKHATSRDLCAMCPTTLARRRVDQITTSTVR